MTAENGAAEASGSRTSSAATDAAAAAKPLVDATHKAYTRLAVHVEKYFENWVDLVEEVKIEQQHDEPADLTIADILVALPEAEVTSEIPGRARLYLPALKGQSVLAEQCAAALGNLPGVDRIQVSSLTGSILVLFDTDEYPSLQDLLSAVGS